MNASSLITSALALALVHAALPTHWLPFVLVGTTEKWNRKKILGILTLAGGGHVFVTAVLGFIAALVGKEIISRVEPKIPIASVILVIFGLVYIGLGLRKHEHFHTKSNQREFASALSLFLMLTLTPCEPMVVVYFTAGAFGLKFLVLLTLIMAGGTLCGMLILTYFALLGYERVKLPWLEAHERHVIGVILAVLGIVFVFYH